QSSYVRDGATRWLADWERAGWRKRDGSPVANSEAWQELARVMGDHDLTWNADADPAGAIHRAQAARLARQAAEERRRAATQGSG
ncbi:MAG: RNase H family protein, partial [Chloroflexota bacterium]